MEQTTGLTIALFLVAVAVLIQAGMTIVIWLALRKIPGQVEAARDNFSSSIEVFTQGLTPSAKFRRGFKVANAMRRSFNEGHSGPA